MKKYLKFIFIILIVSMILIIISCKNSETIISKEEVSSLISSETEKEGFLTYSGGELPQSMGYVNDYSNLISQEYEDKILSEIKKVKEETDAEIVVVIIESLEGKSVDDYTLELFNMWKVSRYGLILLVSENDKIVRVTTGYDMEGVITDDIAGSIIDDVIVPKFQENNFNEGIYEGVKKISEYILTHDPYETSEEYEEVDKFSNILQKASPSVVNIVIEFENEEDVSGEKVVFGGVFMSGIIYTSDGYIITNTTNLKNIIEIKVTAEDGTQFSGNLVGEDRNTNIAVIKIDTQNLEVPNFAPEKELKVGEAVVTISRPTGKVIDFSQGFIKATEINMTVYPDTLPLVDLIQTDIEGKMGTAGSALVSMGGSVIGINSLMMPSAEGEKFYLLATPIEIAINIAEQIIKYGKAKIPNTGIEMGLSDTDISGVIVMGLVENSPGKDAGIEVGDIITEFDGIEVKDPSQLYGQILRKKM